MRTGRRHFMHLHMRPGCHYSVTCSASELLRYYQALCESYHRLPCLQLAFVASHGLDGCELSGREGAVDWLDNDLLWSIARLSCFVTLAVEPPCLGTSGRMSNCTAGVLVCIGVHSEGVAFSVALRTTEVPLCVPGTGRDCRRR